MSHNASHVIIDGLIGSGEFSSEDCSKLEEIKNRTVARCTFSDAWKVAGIVFERLRADDHD